MPGHTLPFLALAGALRRAPGTMLDTHVISPLLLLPGKAQSLRRDGQSGGKRTLDMPIHRQMGIMSERLMKILL